jgi:soluble lytic murein transglycosylase-like protein
MKSLLAWVAVSLALAGAPAHACWDEVARKYAGVGVSADLLRAMARTESGLDPRAVNRTHRQRTGSYDIGLMQINSRWLPVLQQRFGIAEADLYNWCVNLDVGAWILADLFVRYGPSWEAVGAYNAACTSLRGEDCRAARAAYAWRVHRRLPAE